MELLATAVSVVALVPGPPATSHHHRPHVHHRRGCATVRCDRWADRHHKRRLERQRRRQERREAAEAWAIPAEIVRCESDYANDPPNYAGAAGYYQINDWNGKARELGLSRLEGAPNANEHSRREQGELAGALYRAQGSGPWVSSEPCWGGRI